MWKGIQNHIQASSCRDNLRYPPLGSTATDQIDRHKLNHGVPWFLSSSGTYTDSLGPGPKITGRAAVTGSETSSSPSPHSALFF